MTDSGQPVQTPAEQARVNAAPQRQGMPWLRQVAGLATGALIGVAILLFVVFPLYHNITEGDAHGATTATSVPAPMPGTGGSTLDCSDPVQAEKQPICEGRICYDCQDEEPECNDCKVAELEASTSCAAMLEAIGPIIAASLGEGQSLSSILTYAYEGWGYRGEFSIADCYSFIVEREGPPAPVVVVEAPMPIPQPQNPSTPGTPTPPSPPTTQPPTTTTTTQPPSTTTTTAPPSDLCPDHLNPLNYDIPSDHPHCGAPTGEPPEDGS